MGFDIKGLLVVLAIVVMIFGTRRLRHMGGDLGSAIKGFRSAMRDGDKDEEHSEDSDDDDKVIEQHSEAHPQSEHDSERRVQETEDHS